MAKELIERNRAKKLESGLYNYRGYIIKCDGYWHPNHCIVWEAYTYDQEEDIDVVAKGFTKKKMMIEIDKILDTPPKS